MVGLLRSLVAGDDLFELPGLFGGLQKMSVGMLRLLALVRNNDPLRLLGWTRVRLDGNPKKGLGSASLTLLWLGFYEPEGNRCFATMTTRAMKLAIEVVTNAIKTESFR